MSTWNILGSTQKTSLGELQQDTGVGGVLDDGHGMSFDNNAQNSPDQSVALQHWIEAFEHQMLQTGDVESAIAALAAQGCPEPEAVAELWQHTQENPDTTEDLTETVPTEDPTMTPAPQEMGQGAQQPLASTKKTAYDVNTVREWIQKGVPEESILYELSINGEEYLYDEAMGQSAAPQAVPQPGFSLRDRIQERQPQGPQDMQVAAKTADVAGEDYGTGIDTPDAAMEVPGDMNDVAAIAQQMAELGWNGDAEAWLEEANNYHDEDIPMLVADMREQLTQMQAREAQENPEPQLESVQDRAMRDDGSMMTNDGMPLTAKTADLAGSGPRRDKANEIYKAIRRDHPEDDKSSAAAIANAQANKLEAKGDLALGNDDDKKKDDDKGNPFAKKDKGDDKGSDKSESKDDDKKDDDGKPPWLKDKKSAVGARASFQGIDGTVTAVVDDFWANQRMAYLATEHGELSVPVESLEAPTGEAVTDNPIQEINEFLSIIDPAGVMPSTIEARIHNLSQVSAAARKVITEAKVSLADQMALDEIRLNTEAEIQELQQTMEQISTDENQAYLDSQPQYEMHAVEQADFGHQDEGGWIDGAYHDMMADAQAEDYDRVVNEEPALLVNDMSDGVLQDPGAVEGIALSHITNKTYALPAEIREEINTAFMAGVESVRLQALAHRKSLKKKTASAKLDNDGPAESLFI